MFMKKALTEHNLFIIAIVLKGIDGVLEFVGGILLLFISPTLINKTVVLLTQHELSEDPRDWVATHLVKLFHDVSFDTKIFGSVYLLSHGVIKILIIYFLFRKKLWAYPMAIIFFAFFIIYQMYRYFLDFSVGYILLSVLDIFVIILTWLEYKRLKTYIRGI